MTKIMPAAILAIGALLAGPVAQAGDVDVGITIGVPGLMLGGPAYYPPSPPAVVVVPRPMYGPGPHYYYDNYYDKHAYKHAQKRWKKHQKRMWKESRRGYYDD